VSERERALQILERVRREGAFAAPLLESSGDDRDRRFVRHLVLGVLRWQSQLDFLIEQVAERPVKKLEPLTLDILRLGFFQLLYTDVPPHAAVSESVNLARRRAPRATGLMNAVLRKASRADLRSIVPSGDNLGVLAIRTAHPQWLLQRWSERFGVEKCEAIAGADQQLSHPDLLVNKRRISPEDAAATLRERGIDFEQSSMNGDVLRLRESTSRVSEEIEAGLFYAMDEGSIAVARSVPGQARRVLDLAAAPGGKSLVLGLDGHDVISNDVSLRRLLPLRRSWPSMLTTASRMTVSDGRQPSFRVGFDAVLLDAPCSATGTIRRNPEIKWRLKETDLAAFASLQRELLRSALSMTREWCVYSTCSLETEENEAVVEEVLGARSGFGVHGKLVLTPDGGTDGFVIHVIRRL
jgi:16S rRNA (cytosine967-C5)-methyltransferase